MAHLFGFLAGIVSGSLYSLLVKGPKKMGYQAGSLLLTLGLLVMAGLKTF
jgi:hypothetical protein